MGEPLAYLLTWTCHGTWLHGDERGSVTRTQNCFGQPFVEPSPNWVRSGSLKLATEPVVLDERGRAVVRDAVADHCRHRSWSLLALNVRTNHTHAVVAHDPNRSVEDMLVSLKARCTRRLRDAKLVQPGDPVWTRHGSTRYLWKPEDVESAVNYVLANQGPGDRFAVNNL